MNLVIHYDTEATGFPSKKNPPHLVQLAAILSNDDTGVTISSMDVIIRPENWDIPEASSNVHGITTECALAVGIPESLAIRMFMDLVRDNKCSAHNSKFDRQIIDAALARYDMPYYANLWNTEIEHHCTMLAAHKVMGGKWPKLDAALKHFTGKELINAHSAMPDAQACKDIYFAMKQQAPIAPPLKGILR